MDEIELPNDVDALKALLVKAHTELADKNSKIAELEHTIKAFLSKKYGSSSERWEGQPLLFNEAEQQSEQVKTNEEIKVKGFTRKKGGRKSLPDHLPREQEIYELGEDERNCECGSELREIGATITETLEVEPAKIKVVERVRKKYVCPCCEGKFKTAPAPKLPIPNSFASPSLLAHIATCKYVDGLPLNRQEEILRRIGVVIPRSTLASWMIKLSEILTPLINLIRERIIESPLLVMDETHVQVLKEKGRKAQSKSFMWCLVGLDPGKKAVLFEYSPSRSSAIAAELLEGFQGTLITDGYVGYKSVSSSMGIRHAGCWDHARRYFVKAFEGVGKKEGLAAEALRLIAKIYDVERLNREKDSSTRHRARNLYSRSIVNYLKSWLDRNINTVTPRSQTGKALNYLSNEWDRLVIFLEDGAIPISNEKAENAIRPFVVGRKAWLFSTSTEGADASAVIYSLVETAKANKIEPHAYLSKVISALPNMDTLEEIETLLPWNVKI